MYLKREADKILQTWLSSPNRKPLILKGARQTGKSTTIRELANSTDLFIELNLERRTDLSLVRSCTSVEDLLTAIRTRHNITAFPQNTLLFFDEIQENSELVGWLRFFHEDYPELAVIAAGSLLEVRLQERGFSFPVGRVTFRTLFPLTFQEFLRAVGKPVLAEELQTYLGHLKTIPKPVHEEALGLLRDYLLVGGMPEAVVRWVQTGQSTTVREVHSDLLQAFSEDFQKYRGIRDLDPLEAAFENIKYHTGTRFSYASFAPGRRSQQIKTALGRLEAAALITRAWPTSDLNLPLRPRQKSAPKLLPLDTGLTLTMIGMSIEELRTLPYEKLIDGRLAEMFVGQQLLSGRSGKNEPLYFWVSESSRGSAEVDYLIPVAGKLYPLEVKAGATGSLKSLHQFLHRAEKNTAFRLYSGNIMDQNLEVIVSGESLRYRLVSVPIYLAQMIWEMAELITD
jgi:uncharacterized protein